jgi:hypothetical protein
MNCQRGHKLKGLIPKSLLYRKLRNINKFIFTNLFSQISEIHWSPEFNPRYKKKFVTQIQKKSIAEK